LLEYSVILERNEHASNSYFHRSEYVVMHLTQHMYTMSEAKTKDLD